MNHLSPADLDWLAFQYVAGELQGPELEVFEQLLATDDRACAAVAQAVQLGQAVIRCEQQDNHVVTDRRPAPYRLRLWRSALTVAGSALSVAVLVSWLNLQSPPRELASGRDTALAALWVQNADDEIAQEAGPAVSIDANEFEDEDAVPAWLLAAVTEEQAADADRERVMQD